MKATGKALRLKPTKQETEEKKAETMKTNNDNSEMAQQLHAGSSRTSSNPRSDGQPRLDDLIKPASAHSSTSSFDLDTRECKY